MHKTLVQIYSLVTGTAQSVVQGYGLDVKRTVVRFPTGAKDLFFQNLSRHALQPTQPHNQRIVCVLAPGVRWPDREPDKLTFNQSRY